MSETENMDERMKAFTPGPWTSVLEGSGKNPNIGDWGVDGANDRSVCSYATKADARLIAAAPDLLAFVAAIAGRGLTGDAYGTGREEDELTLNARTLLLKATGTP